MHVNPLKSIPLINDVLFTVAEYDFILHNFAGEFLTPLQRDALKVGLGYLVIVHVLSNEIGWHIVLMCGLD
jgi:hypothetical protein